MDKQASEDCRVCTGACMISSSIREKEDNLAAYQKASMLIGQLLKTDDVSGDGLKTYLKSSLNELFPSFITNLVVKEIMKVYDSNLAKLQENEKLVRVLEATKSSIDSGIQLGIKTGRPVKIVPKDK